MMRGGGGNIKNFVEGRVNMKMCPFKDIMIWFTWFSRVYVIRVQYAIEDQYWLISRIAFVIFLHTCMIVIRLYQQFSNSEKIICVFLNSCAKREKFSGILLDSLLKNSI